MGQERELVVVTPLQTALTAPETGAEGIPPQVALIPE
jgi:hypothetical protein